LRGLFLRQKGGDGVVDLATGVLRAGLAEHDALHPGADRVVRFRHHICGLATGMAGSRNLIEPGWRADIPGLGRTNRTNQPT
jgi:hypothetical protein